jgi:dihydroflavonol-4-reductase
MGGKSEIAAVSGATGFIGSAVIRRLLEDGRPVRALVEPGAPTNNLDALPSSVDRVTVDVCDHAGMRRALEGCAAYYHLAAIYKIWTPDPRPIWRVNVEGTTTALLAAQAAAVPRVVYTSSIAAVGVRDDGAPSDESVPFNLWDIANHYLVTKTQSERIALRFSEVMPVVVVNPAFPFGPGDRAPTPTGKLILTLLRGQVPAVGGGGFCAVDVDDVAAAHVAAETRGRVGERYILGNHNLTYRAFCALVADVAGVPSPRFALPDAVARTVAWGLERWSDLVTHEEPLATARSLAYLQRRLWFDTQKAKRELGLPETPLRASIERAVRWFRDEGLV